MCYNRPCKCSCDMKLIHSEKKYIVEFTPGTFTYSVEDKNGIPYKTIWMKLPDNALCVIPIEPTGSDKDHWTWNGNFEKPTLTPTLVHWTVEDGVKCEAWRGNIENGRMESV
jgi:hypothetical protein